MQALHFRWEMFLLLEQIEILTADLKCSMGGDGGDGAWGESAELD